MNYEDMSDREIEILVWMAGDSKPRNYIMNGKSLVLVEDCGRMIIQDVPKYCNNPSDAWPIIVENKIAILPSTQGAWLSYGWKKWDGKQDPSPRKEHADKNPLRAAMICFLKMKDAEK